MLHIPALQLRQLTTFIPSVILTEHFGVRIDDKLPTILMSLPLRDELFVDTCAPELANKAATDSALRKARITQAVASCIQRFLCIPNSKHTCTG